MTTRYRIFCETDNKWEQTWSDVPLTQCPVNAGHTVISNSTQEVPIKYGTGIRLEFKNSKYSRKQLRTGSWKKLTTYGFPGTDTIGFLRSMNIVSNMKAYNGKKNDVNGNGNSKFGYYIRIYDQTNKQTVYESGFLGGTSAEDLKMITDINDSNLSSGPALWIIGMRRDDHSGDAYLDGIDMYFYKV